MVQKEHDQEDRAQTTLDASSCLSSVEREKESAIWAFDKMKHHMAKNYQVKHYE